MKERLHEGVKTKSLVSWAMVLLVRPKYSLFRHKARHKGLTWLASGKKIAVVAEALGMKVLISDRKGQPRTDGRTPFDEVVRASTVIFASLPRTPDTLNLLSTPEFESMQTECVLINVSRGGIVNEEALMGALEQGQISGAATDVYAQEPVSEGVSPLIGPRASNLNLVTTPHCAWCAEETLEKSNKTVENSVASWIAGNPINIVS